MVLCYKDRNLYSCFKVRYSGFPLRVNKYGNFPFILFYKSPSNWIGIVVIFLYFEWFGVVTILAGGWTQKNEDWHKKLNKTTKTLFNQNKNAVMAAKKNTRRHKKQDVALKLAMLE